MARGSVFRKDNGWAFRVDAGLNPETVRRRQMLRQGFRTKKTAEDALAELTADRMRGATVAGTTVRVKDYLADWLLTTRSKLIDAPQLLDGCRPDRCALQIERFYTDLLENGGRDGKPLTPKTVRNTHVVLRKALADAERRGLVPRNAAAAAKPPAPTKCDIQTWTLHGSSGEHVLGG